MIKTRIKVYDLIWFIDFVFTLNLFNLCDFRLLIVAFTIVYFIFIIMFWDFIIIHLICLYSRYTLNRNYEQIIRKTTFTTFMLLLVRLTNVISSYFVFLSVLVHSILLKNICKLRVKVIYNVVV